MSRRSRSAVGHEDDLSFKSALLDPRVCVARRYTKVSHDTFVHSTRRCSSGVIPSALCASIDSLARQTSLPNKEQPMTLKKPQHPPGSSVPSLTRRDFLARSGTAISVSPFLFVSPTHAKETTMISDTEAVAAAQAPSIRPFSYRATDEELNDLRRRVAAVRLPDKEPVSDFSQGVKLATVQKLARYWATAYDLRKVEARMNSL